MGLKVEGMRGGAVRNFLLRSNSELILRGGLGDLNFDLLERQGRGIAVAGLCDGKEWRVIYGSDGKDARGFAGVVVRFFHVQDVTGIWREYDWEQPVARFPSGCDIHVLIGAIHADLIRFDSEGKTEWGGVDDLVIHFGGVGDIAQDVGQAQERLVPFPVNTGSAGGFDG